LLSAPVSHPCWNRKCEETHGDKYLRCATPSVHTATPLGMLSGDVPCSQAQRTHSRTGTTLQTFWSTLVFVNDLEVIIDLIAYSCFRNFKLRNFRHADFFKNNSHKQNIRIMQFWKNALDFSYGNRSPVRRRWWRSNGTAPKLLLLLSWWPMLIQVLDIPKLCLLCLLPKTHITYFLKLQKLSHSVQKTLLGLK
jgi:hypothetical protein